MTPKTPTSNDAAIGWRVQKLRKAKGLSRSDLSRAIGVTSPQLLRYETGENRVNAGRLHKIADALAVPISALYGDNEGGDQSDTPISPRDIEAGELLRAYAEIKDPQLRRYVVTTVQTAARFRARPGRPNDKPREP